MPSQNAIKAGEVFVEAFLKDVQFTAALDRIRSRMKAVSTQLRELSGLGIGIGAAMVPVISTFVKFDDAMLMLEAVTEGTNAEFTKLKESAMSLAQTTSYTASEVAGLMVELGKAGFSRKEIDQMTESVLNLAKASGTDATISAQYLSSTIRQFSMDASQSSRVADLLAATANKSSVSVTDLGISLSYAGKLASDSNLSLEQTLAILGVLGDFTIKGDMAGTALRRMVAVVGTSQKQIRQFFGDIDVSDATGKLRSMVDVMGDIEEATKSMTQVERLQKFKDLFELLGINTASVIAKGAGSIKEFEAALQGVDGYAATAAKKMDSGLGGTFRRVRATAEAAAIAIGEVLVPALSGASLIVSNLTKSISTWIKENQDLAATIGVIVVGLMLLLTVGAGLYVVSIAFGGLAAAIGLVVAVVKLLIAGILFLMSPVGLVIVAIGLLVAMADSMEEAIGGVFAIIALPIMAATVVVIGLIAVLKVLWSVVVIILKSFRELVNAVFDFIGITGSFNAGIDSIRSRVTQTGVELANLAHGIGQVFKEMFEGLKLALMKGDLATAGKIAMLGLETVFLRTWQFLLMKWFDFTNSIVDYFDNAVISIKVAFIDLFQFLATKMKDVYDILVRPFIDSLVVVRILTQDRANEMHAPIDKGVDRVKALRDEAVNSIADDTIAERKKRNKGQTDKISEIGNNANAAHAAMRELIDGLRTAIAPMPREVNMDLRAPMPHEPGKTIKELNGQIGDSARGVFQSADYAGSLGIGAANKAAQDQLQKLGDIHGTLKDIDGSIKNLNVFG